MSNGTCRSASMNVRFPRGSTILGKSTILHLSSRFSCEFKAAFSRMSYGTRATGGGACP